jgi:pilus assembly protein FimV
MSWKLRAAISALLLAPQAAFPLGLGDIRLNSALNEPLSAEIELVAPTAEELGSLSAKLASRELFQRIGVDRPSFLDTVRFQVGRGRDGRNVLLVSSAAPISEPFVTFLVEVNWPRGRLLREYTVLLDPPVFAPEEAVVPAPIAAPQTPRAATPSAPVRPRPAPEPAAPVTAAPSGGQTASTYRVRSGDTLYEVASQFTDGSRSQVNRMMVAMFRDNPEAFGGNVNVLRAGAILRVPGQEALADVSASEASSEIGRQAAAWKGGEVRQEPARLRLVTPEAAPEGGASAASATDVETRISDLNREIEESRRLLELKSAELAQLQQELSEKEAAAAMAAATPTAPPAAEPPAEPAAPAAGVEPAAPAAPEPPAEKPAAEPPTPAPVVTERSFVENLTDNWTYVLGAAVLLLGGGLAIGYVRRRREEDLDEAMRTFEPSSGSAPVPSETQRLRALAVGEELHTNTEEQEEEDFRSATLPPVRRTDLEKPAAFADTYSAETPVEIDQGDPLAEADFHMAYGLYDQAADIVKLALDGEPGRRDLHTKLLEIYFVAGNKEGFLKVAEELSGSRTEGDAAEWDRVVIMGRQLAPESPLFAGQASSGGVDLNLEGGAGRVDLELLSPPDGEEGLDLDLGEEPGAGDGAAEVNATEVLDFDLEEAAQGEAPTAEMPRLFEEGTAEMPSLDSTSVDAPVLKDTRQQVAQADTTAEMPMDDLGIDLDALADIAEEDDITRAAASDDSTQEMPAGGADALDLDLSELPGEGDAAGELGETVETPVVDLDVGASITDRGSDFTATEQISLDELPDVAELEPVTMSEVGTKLDLARAYVDMGDPDGARSILDEVLKEGSNSQKQEAQRLLDTLPGA